MLITPLCSPRYWFLISTLKKQQKTRTWSQALAALVGMLRNCFFFLNTRASRKECGLHLRRSAPVRLTSQLSSGCIKFAECSGQNPAASWRRGFAFVRLRGGEAAGWLRGTYLHFRDAAGSAAWVNALAWVSPRLATLPALYPIWEYEIMLSFLLGVF